MIFELSLTILALELIAHTVFAGSGRGGGRSAPKGARFWRNASQTEWYVLFGRGFGALRLTAADGTNTLLAARRQAPS